MTEKELSASRRKEVRTPGEPTAPLRYFVPHVDIYETEQAVTLLAEMPGVEKDRVEIDLDDKTLTIKGNMIPEDETGRRYLLKEYESGSFVRSFTISEAIDPADIQASMNFGILTVTLPKARPAQPKKIAVREG